jgi:DNA modification methylase
MSKTTKIKDLIPDNKNFNKGTEYGNSLIEKSLRKFGAGRSILIDKNNRIIAGNKTIENAAAIGLEDLQIVESDGTKIIAVKRTDIDLDSKAGRELALADNATAKANIDWDIETTFEVANEFGFDAGEWGIKEEEVEKLEAEEDDFDTTPPEIPITVLGDLYEIGEHRLLCGDSTDSDQVAKLMNGSKADMVFTDPPWNVNYGAVKEGNAMGYKPRTIMNDSMSTDDFKDFMGSAFAMMAMHSKKGCPTYVVMSAQEWGNLMLALHENNYHWSSTIIWNKSHLVMSRKDYHTKYEPIWYGWLEGAPRLCPVEDRKQSDVWDVDRPTKSELHPTTKPIALIDIALKNSSKVGNLIFELFTGSGSTMVASHQLKRKCYGMELDPKYCDVIVRRMIKLDPTLSVKRNGVDCKAEFQ